MSASRPPEHTRRAGVSRELPDRQTRVLMFNVAFFGTLAWLASAARAADASGWWHQFGQLPLVLGGLILFWIGWWHLDAGRDRQALTVLGPAVAILSIWFTSVHGAAL